MEIDALSKLLELVTVDYLTLIALVVVSLVVFGVCELYKLIVRKKQAQTFEIKTN